MMRRFVSLLLALVFLTVAPVLAGGPYPPLTGHLIDGTERVDKTRFENSVTPLVSLGAIPLGIVHNGAPDGTAYTLYEAEILANYGYGVPEVARTAFPPETTPLDPNIVAIAIDYGGRNLSVYVGDNWADEIGQGGINAILDEVAKSAMSDPTTALEAGFLKAFDLMDPPMARAMREFTATVLPMIPYALTGILLLALSIWLVRKLSQVGKAKHEIGLVIRRWDDVVDRFSAGQHRLTVIVNLLSGDYPDEATKWTNSGRRPQEAMAGMEHELARLSAVRLGIFSSTTTVAETVAAYQAVMAGFELVEDWVVGVINEAKHLEDQAGGVRELLFRVKPEVVRVQGWYDTVQRNNSRILPPKDHVFGGLNAELESAEELVLYQSGGELRGARILTNLRDILEALERAASVVVEAEGHGLAMMGKTRDALSSWIGELPTLEALAASPLATLAAAITQLTDDSDYKDVVEPAESAKAGFEALAKMATALATSLRHRDDIAADLKNTFFDRGFQNHVVVQLRAAATALAAGVSAICAGEWQAATNHLTLSHTETENAFLRMARLAELRNTNSARLSSLSQRVAAADSHRLATVGPLFTSLQSGFAQTNWVEVASNFGLATTILGVLFDKPDDASDLASQVAALNSMDEQRFEDAEKKLNELYRLFQQALSLLESIVNRHALCVKARDTHAAALAGATARLAEARVYLAEHDTDIDLAVEEGLAEAETAIVAGRRAASERYYVLALDRADAAAALISKALDSAKGQVSQNGQLREELARVKAEAVETVNSAVMSVRQANSSVVREETERAVRDAVSALEQAKTAEAGTSALEDRKLASALGSAIHAYVQARKSADLALKSLAGDKESYNKLLSEANQALDSANKAISSAASFCNDHRAGSAGDGDLASARSLLPDPPSKGDTRTAIRQAKNDADAAKAKAEAAEKAAKAAIRRYEDREAAERAAAAAKKRADEVARQQALSSAQESARRATVSSGGISGGTKMTGGISGRRKF